MAKKTFLFVLMQWGVFTWILSAGCSMFNHPLNPEDIDENTPTSFFERLSQAESIASMELAETAILECHPAASSQCDGCIKLYAGTKHHLWLRILQSVEKPFNQQRLEQRQGVSQVLPGPMWAGVLVIHGDIPIPVHLLLDPADLESGSLADVTQEMLGSTQGRTRERGSMVERLAVIGNRNLQLMEQFHPSDSFDFSGLPIVYLKDFQAISGNVKEQKNCSSMAKRPNLESVNSQIGAGVAIADLLACSDDLSELRIAPSQIGVADEPDTLNVIQVRNIGPSALEARLFCFGCSLTMPPLLVPPGQTGQLVIPSEFNSNVAHNAAYDIRLNPTGHPELPAYALLRSGTSSW